MVFKYSVLKNILQMKDTTLLASLNKIMRRYYNKDNIILTSDYLFIKGAIPVLLLAHLDTVHPAPPSLIFKDADQHVIWSPEGLGADDRAGVFAILELVKAGYRPSILFCMGEEVGGLGARSFIRDYPDPPISINFMLELDRQGRDDAVYYDCGNKEFETFINNFGFFTDLGSFSDISIIAPIWDIAAVNLSIGYFNEHSAIEMLQYRYMYETILKVEKILRNENTVKYDFQETLSPYFGPYTYLYPREYDGKILCDACDREFPADQIRTIHDMYEGDTWRLCPECYELNKDLILIEGSGPSEESKDNSATN